MQKIKFFTSTIDEKDSSKNFLGKKHYCTCKQSKCIKNYCECFAKGEICDKETCKCVNCENTKKTKEGKNKKNELEESKEVCCNCKKSHCMKNYCECFQKGRKCGEKCTCVECKNENELETKKKDCGFLTLNVCKKIKLRRNDIIIDNYDML